MQAAPGVLANDTDANGDPLTAVLNTNVTHGSLALNANGGFTYTPTAGYSGPDSFTYHANDGTANSNIVTVSLTVTASAATQPLDALAASASTSDKPQSKLWQHDGAGGWSPRAPRRHPPGRGSGSSSAWVGALSSGCPPRRIPTPTSGRSATSRTSCCTGRPALYSVQYNTSTDTYEPWASRPTGTSITLTGSETATIDVDSTGRMWLATENGANLNVYYSDSPYTTFSGPVTLASNINGDDIGVVTALPNNTIGVLWSNQTTKRFGFKVHVDGAVADTWSADEVPASQSADDSLGAAFGMADDHLNVKVPLTARSTRPSRRATTPPAIRRSRSSSADRTATGTTSTRSIRPAPAALVVINEASNLLRIVYTSTEGFNPIVYKESALSSISFGPRQTMMASAFNDVSSTKQNWTTAGRRRKQQRQHHRRRDLRQSYAMISASAARAAGLDEKVR